MRCPLTFGGKSFSCYIRSVNFFLLCFGGINALCSVTNSIYGVHCLVRANTYLVATYYVDTVSVFVVVLADATTTLTLSLSLALLLLFVHFFVSFLSGACCAGVPRRLGTTFHRDRIRRGPHRGPLPSHAVLLRAGSCRGREGCCFCLCRCCLYQVIIAGWMIVVDHYIRSDSRGVDACTSIERVIFAFFSLGFMALPWPVAVLWLPPPRFHLTK